MFEQLVFPCWGGREEESMAGRGGGDGTDFFLLKTTGGVSREGREE